MNRTYPKTFYPIPQPKRQTLGSLSSQKPPFRPVSPAEAREEASRPHEQRFVNCFAPYESDRQCFIADRTTDRIKDLQPPFSPTCPSQAKETIEVDYYLYSPKPEEKQAERDTIRERSTANRQQLRELFATRRGHTLV
ncbi:hypothetical protein DUNSADRAFT_17714 [Dunaliella salina]|uniref:Encoded protein n=1 Tax=Dunaliella salina TaxID=3046 RepID=A0ABQ7GZT2_DUNSA|nr:hypothetical protein DUNSADRAFT_17714 [Dunaliella salina]|eukprot:KAF5840113.1 hypothetical protein DUNSADRAFT_17714 [Dunaliella salina]